jgi:hypothetical protein
MAKERFIAKPDQNKQLLEGLREQLDRGIPA